MLGGSFDAVNGVARNGVARLNANGTLDTAFDAGAGANPVESIMVLPDGKIMVGGSFTKVGGLNQCGIARLYPDGTLDTFFIPHDAVVRASSFGLQGDGALLLGGWLAAIIGSSPVNYRFGSLNDGALVDWGIDAFTGDTSYGRGVTLQPDGKFLACGDGLDGIDGIARKGIARITNPDARCRNSRSHRRAGITWALGGSYPWPYQVLFEDSDDGATWQELGWGTAVAGVGYRLAGQSLPVQDQSLRARDGLVSRLAQTTTRSRSTARCCGSTRALQKYSEIGKISVSQ